MVLSPPEIPQPPDLCPNLAQEAVVIESRKRGDGADVLL